MTENAQVVLPANINLTADSGPYARAKEEKEQKLLRQVKGVMFLDKLEQDRILKEETPKYEKAVKQVEVLGSKITTLAKRVVSGLKKDDRVAALKDAMKDFGFSVVVIPEFKGVDLDVEDAVSIKYAWGVKESGDHYCSMNSEDIDLEMPAEAKPLLEKYWEARKEVIRAKDAIIAAQEKLHDRANRMADAEGALAIRGMDENERGELKGVYEDVIKNGTNPAKLLGAGK